jgi:hypothetical protein
VHAPPPEGSQFSYPHEQRPPSGAELSRYLAAECGFPGADVNDLQRVALYYELEASRARLVDAMAHVVADCTTPSAMLRALARLDFPIVVTTNYDQLFEKALQEQGKMPRVIVYNPVSEPTRTVGRPTAESPIICKLHGDISKPESIVVTDEDYLQFVERMFDVGLKDPIPLMLKYHLSEWTRLLIGYSMMDFNLRLLFKMSIDPTASGPMYSVSLRPDPLLVQLWGKLKRRIDFIPWDLWTFVPRLYECVLDEELSP